MQFTLGLPDWAVDENHKLAVMPSLEKRMAAVIRFSRLNLKYQTGGPFAAGVFEAATGKPIVIGVNRVMAHGISSAHAEVMALSLAQKILGTWNLGAAGMSALQLVVNWRPCAMCFGATLWSGVRSLVIAGSGPELEQITGFDEGPVHPDWRHELERRGIDLVEDVLTDQAVEVFREFGASGAVVYNGR
jgi:tRNA(Arg) A34 adenosine deaminase TadA